jgi:hypothetical protein
LGAGADDVLAVPLLVSDEGPGEGKVFRLGAVGGDVGGDPLRKRPLGGCKIVSAK